MKAVAVAFGLAWLETGVEPQPEDDRARDRLAAFRGELYPLLHGAGGCAVRASGHGAVR